MSVYGDIKLRALLPVGREKRAYDMSNLRDDAVSSLLAGVGGALGGGARRHADISTRATSPLSAPRPAWSSIRAICGTP